MSKFNSSEAQSIPDSKFSISAVVVCRSNSIGGVSPSAVKHESKPIGLLFRWPSIHTSDWGTFYYDRVFIPCVFTGISLVDDGVKRWGNQKIDHVIMTPEVTSQFSRCLSQRNYFPRVYEPPAVPLTGEWGLHQVVFKWHPRRRSIIVPCGMK